MNWVMGLSGLITIFLVWKISDLIYKQNIKSHPPGEILFAVNNDVVIRDNIISGTKRFGIQLPETLTEIDMKTNEHLYNLP